MQNTKLNADQQKLVMDNYPFALFLCRRLAKRFPLVSEDLQSEILHAICRAALLFDPLRPNPHNDNKPYSFRTYAGWAVWTHLISLTGKQIRRPVTFTVLGWERVPDDEEAVRFPNRKPGSTIHKEVVFREEVERLREGIALLPQPLRTIIEDKLNYRTLTDSAKQFGISREGVRQKALQAMRLLRQHFEGHQPAKKRGRRTGEAKRRAYRRV